MIRHNRKHLFLLSVFCAAGMLLTGGCTFFSQKVAPEAFLKEVEAKKTDLTATKSIGPWKIETITLPGIYSRLVSRQRGMGEGIATGNDEHEIDFQVIIRLTAGAESVMRYGLDSYAAYDKRNKYFSFDIYRDLFVIAGRDTFPCISHHFEQYYELAPHVVINAAFSIPESQTAESASDWVLLYQDRELGLGPVRIRLPRKAFRELPEVDLSAIN